MLAVLTLQQVCYYVLHRHIQKECLLYFVYRLWKYITFFDTNLGLIVDGFFYYSSLFNTEGILLLSQNVFVRFKVHFSLRLCGN